MSTELENLTKLEPSRQYLLKKMASLMKNHPDQYVAIADGNLVFADDSLDNLLSKVKDKFGNTQSVLIEYIASKHLQVVV
jgi:hypothetical protein